jgi:hypothetical protein
MEVLGANTLGKLDPAGLEKIDVKAHTARRVFLYCLMKTSTYVLKLMSITLFKQVLSTMQYVLVLVYFNYYCHVSFHRSSVQHSHQCRIADPSLSGHIEIMVS